MLSGRDEAEAQNARACEIRREAKAHREAREAAVRKETIAREAKEAAERRLSDRSARVKGAEDVEADLAEARSREKRLSDDLRRLGRRLEDTG